MIDLTEFESNINWLEWEITQLSLKGQAPRQIHVTVAKKIKEQINDLYAELEDNGVLYCP